MINVIQAPEFLHNVLQFDTDSGLLRWKCRDASLFTSGKQSAAKNCAIWNGRYANKPAFTARDARGYLHGTIFNRSFTAHRVVWAMCYGSWPAGIVDHIDADRTNNRLQNLRLATVSENQMNRSAPSSNVSGAKGVHWCNTKNRWIARAMKSGRTVHLGSFSNVIDAKRAAVEGRQRMHGAFARD